MQIKNANYYFETVNNDGEQYPRLKNLFQLDKNQNNALMLYFEQNDKKHKVKERALELSQEQIEALLHKVNLYHKNLLGKTAWMLFLKSDVSLSAENQKQIFSCALDEKDLKNRDIFYYLSNTWQNIDLKVLGENFIYNYKYLILENKENFYDLLYKKVFFKKYPNAFANLLNYFLINSEDKDKIAALKYWVSQDFYDDKLTLVDQIETAYLIFKNIQDKSLIEIDKEAPLDNNLLLFIEKLSAYDTFLKEFINENYNLNFKKSLLLHSIEHNENFFIYLINNENYKNLASIDMFFNIQAIRLDNTMDFLIRNPQIMNFKQIQDKHISFLVNHISYSNKISKNQERFLDFLLKKAISFQNKQFINKIYYKIFTDVQNYKSFSGIVMPYICQYMLKEKDFFKQDKTLLQDLLSQFTLSVSSGQHYNEEKRNLLLSQLVVMININIDNEVAKHTDDNGYSAFHYFVELLSAFKVSADFFEKDFLETFLSSNRGILDQKNEKIKEIKKYVYKFELKNVFSIFKKGNKNNSNGSNNSNNNINNNKELKITENDIEQINSNLAMIMNFVGEDLKNTQDKEIFKEINKNYNFLYTETENKNDLMNYFSWFNDLFDNYKNYQKIYMTSQDKSLIDNAYKMFMETANNLNSLLSEQSYNLHEKILTEMKIKNMKNK